MPGDGNELEIDCLSPDDETQQQPSKVVQGEEVGETNETAAGNKKKETFTAIPPTPIENQKLNIGKSLLTRDAQKGNRNAGRGTKKKKSLENSNPVTKRGSRHGKVICTEILSIIFKFQ